MLTPISGATNAVYTATATGTYFLTVTNIYGCTVTSNAITVSAGSATHIFAGNDTTLCQGPILLNVIGGGTGSTYSWSPTAGLTPSTGPSVSALPTVTTSYTVSVTTEGGCIGKDTVTIVVPVDCAPCGVFEGVPFMTITSPTISSLLPNTNYYFPSTILVKAATGIPGGAVPFSNDIMLMAPGDSIKVDYSTKLSMHHCHLFSCTDTMWQGIVVKTNGLNTISGRIYLDSNTLVEDAVMGVLEFSNPVMPVGYNPLNANPALDTVIISVNGAIFNKDNFGVYLYLEGLSSSVPLQDTILPFRFRNAVYTCRDFSSYNDGTGTATTDYYPFQWPKTLGGHGGLKDVITASNPGLPPFNIEKDAPYTGGSRYYGITCNNHSYTTAGIYAQDLGRTQVNSDSSVTYWSLLIGDGYDSSYNFLNRNQNLFDTIQQGIYSKGTNAICYNNAFGNIFETLPTALWKGAGITGYGSTAATRYRLDVLDFTSPWGGITQNLFYNCAKGVYGNNYYKVIGHNSLIITAHIGSAFSSTDIGQYGYSITTPNYSIVNITQNAIYNVHIAVGLQTSVSSYEAVGQAY